ncbi:hypothetical protein ABIB57_001947 [Devosia sp. UYZn731]|uniref:hypothetical protein n=1 Tax=Devosia sp. UYZn731 TaxID=3156345 RepID=UPI003391EBDB
MIIDLPCNYWIHGYFPYRQRPILRETVSEPFYLAEIHDADFPLVVSTEFAGVGHSWRVGPDDLYYRHLLTQEGLPATIDDLKNADGEQLFGHYIRRDWWRDHPSSVDLALEADIRLAWAPPAGEPGTSFDPAKGKHIQYRPQTRDAVQGRVQRRVDLLTNTKHGLLVRSPLPGFVVQKAGDNITVDRWLPPINEGDGPIRLYFAAENELEAQECARLLANVPWTESDWGEESEEHFLDEDLVAYGQLVTPPTAIPAAKMGVVDYPYLWHPLRSSLAAVYAQVANRIRSGDLASQDVALIEGRSGIVDFYSIAWCVRELRECGPVAGVPQEAIETVIRSAVGDEGW